MPRPAFAITRRGQEAVHEIFVGLGAAVSQEMRHLHRSGRQPDEVKAQAPNQGAPVGGRRRSHFFLLEFGEDEQVNGITRPFGVLDVRQRLTGGGFETPPVGFVGWLSESGAGKERKGEGEQTPNSKLQRSFKLQAPNRESRGGRRLRLEGGLLACGLISLLRFHRFGLRDRGTLRRPTEGHFTSKRG